MVSGCVIFTTEIFNRKDWKCQFTVEEHIQKGATQCSTVKGEMVIRRQYP